MKTHKGGEKRFHERIDDRNKVINAINFDFYRPIVPTQRDEGRKNKAYALDFVGFSHDLCFTIRVVTPDN